jgi:hypothetical protein
MADELEMVDEVDNPMAEPAPVKKKEESESAAPGAAAPTQRRSGTGRSIAADSRLVGARADTWQMDDMLGHTLSDGHRLRKLGPKELIAVRRAFNDIDSDGSGHIDIIEVRDCVGFGQPVPMSSVPMSSVLTVLPRHAVRSAPWSKTSARPKLGRR